MDNAFKKICGDFTIEVSPPYHRWVRLRYGKQQLCGFTSEELHDLKFLVDRAITEVAKMEERSAELARSVAAQTFSSPEQSVR